MATPTISANHLKRIAKNKEFAALILRDFQNASRASICIAPVIFEDHELFDKETITYLNNTKEAFVFNYVREAIHYYIVMGLARIWDTGKGSDIRSVPKYIDFLRGKEIREAWVTAKACNQRLSELTIGELIPSNNSKFFDQYDDILSTVEIIANEREFIQIRKRLTRWRNEQGAHSLHKQLSDSHLDEDEKRSEWGDYEILIDRADKALSAVTQLFDRNFVDHQENYSSYAPIATRYWRISSGTSR